MTPRHPSAEERALWHAANRSTRRRVIDPVEETPGVAADDTPAPAPPPVSQSARFNKKPAVPLPPLKPLARRDAAKLRAMHVVAVLDLHGLSKIDAYGRVGEFLAQQQRAGSRHVLIITGKGRQGEGVLRASLPHWLNEAPNRARVAGFATASAEKGGSGVLHVLVKRGHD